MKISVLVVLLLAGIAELVIAEAARSEACLKGYCGAELIAPPALSSRTSPPRVSIIGRPENNTSEFLAHCAGFMDVLGQVEGRHPSDWLSGEDFMKAAIAQRERPSMADLQSQRMASYTALLFYVPESRKTHSTDLIHLYVICRGNYELQNFEMSVK
jgi:hypothetical protein